MAIRHDLDGLRMQLPGDTKIYLIDRGQKRLVPDAMTYNNLFRDWNNIIQDPHLDEIDTGLPLTSGAVFGRGFIDPRVYLVDQGQKRWIETLPTADRNDFAIYKTYNVPEVVIDVIQAGEPIVWPES